MSRSPVIGVAVVLIAVATVCGLPVLATAYEARSPDYQCAIAQTLPANAELERGASGALSLWPFGLECRYTDASGQALIVSPGWFATGLASASLAAVLAAITVTVVGSARSARFPEDQSV